MDPYETATPSTVLSTNVKQAVNAVSISPNKRWVVAAQVQANRPKPTLSLFDLQAPRTKPRALVTAADNAHSVFDAVFINDGQVLFLEEDELWQHAYQLFDLRTDRMETLLTLPRQYQWPRLPTVGRLLLAPANPPILYDFVARTAVRELVLPADLPGIADGVWGIDDDEHVLLAGREGHVVRRVHLPTQRVVQEYTLPFLAPSQLFATPQYCGAIGDGARGAYLWHRNTGVPVGNGYLNNKDLYVFSFCLSPDETQVALGTRASFVDVQEVKSGRLVYSQRLHGHDRVWALAFSADGQMLISGGSRGDVIVTELP